MCQIVARVHQQHGLKRLETAFLVLAGPLQILRGQSLPQRQVDTSQMAKRCDKICRFTFVVLLPSHPKLLVHTHDSRLVIAQHGPYAIAENPFGIDQVAQDLFLSVFHAISHTFTMTGAVKVIENHLGKAFVKLVQQVVVTGQAPAQIVARPAQPPTSQEPQQSERAKKKQKKTPPAKRASRPKRKTSTKKKS